MSHHNIPRELSDVQFILLGLIINAEQTGTELRKVLRDEFGWDTSTSSFYTYYDRLANEGLCSTKKSKKSGRRFKITRQGKSAFTKKLSFLRDSVERFRTVKA